MEKVYKVVYKGEKYCLFSCILTFGPYQKIYRDDKGILTVDNSLCFDTEENASLFYKEINPFDKYYYEIWEAEAEAAEYLEWVIEISDIEKAFIGEFDNLVNMNRKELSNISYDAPKGTMFCKNVRLVKKL